MVNKKNKKKKIIYLVLGIIFLAIISNIYFFNIVNFQSNDFNMTNVVVNGNFIELKPIYQQEGYNTRWALNKEILTSMGVTGTISDDAYINDVGQGNAFCGAYNGVYVGVSSIVSGTRYFYDSGTWQSDGFDEDIAQQITCNIITGYENSGNYQLIEPYITTQTYNGFKLVDFVSFGNVGEVKPYMIINSEKHFFQNGTIVLSQSISNGSITYIGVDVLNLAGKPHFSKDFDVDYVLITDEDTVVDTVSFSQSSGGGGGGSSNNDVSTSSGNTGEGETPNTKDERVNFVSYIITGLVLLVIVGLGYMKFGGKK